MTHSYSNNSSNIAFCPNAENKNLKFYAKSFGGSDKWCESFKFHPSFQKLMIQ